MGVNHVAHYGVTNPTPPQDQSPNSSSNYDLRKMTKITLQTSARTRSDAKKWLRFLKEREISKP